MRVPGKEDSWVGGKIDFIFWLVGLTYYVIL